MIPAIQRKSPANMTTLAIRPVWLGTQLYSGLSVRVEHGIGVGTLLCCRNLVNTATPQLPASEADKINHACLNPQGAGIPRRDID